MPNKKQEELMFKHVNYSRFVRNKLVEQCNNLNDKGLSVNRVSIHKEYNKIKGNNLWLKEVSVTSLNNVSRNLYNDYLRYFNKKARRPKFNSKKRSKKYFYPREGHNRLYVNENQELQVEKIGKIKISKGSWKNNKEKLFKVQEIDRIRKPIITYDGKYWYINITYREDLISDSQTKKELSDEVIGIDLGIKTLATCSDGKSYKNINKSSKVKKLEKQLKRKQRQLSRKYEMNKDKLRIYHLDKEGKPIKTKSGMYKTSLLKTKNIIKLEKEIKLLIRRLKNIRNNYIHTMTKEIVEQYPQEIVIEDLKIGNMLKNKHLSKHISKAKWFDIKQYLTYKCEDRGILLTVANTYYPSSQTCSHCGNRLTKQDKLSLKDRTFNCTECNSSLDRDLNASINLMNYRYSKWYRNYIDSK